MPKPTFLDSAGREWTVRLTGPILTRLREHLGYEILITTTPDGFATWKGLEVIHNPTGLADVLRIMLASQFDRTGIPWESFWDSYDDETYRGAADALRVAVCNFSLDPAALLRILRGDGGESPGRISPSNNGATNSPALAESIPETTASTF